MPDNLLLGARLLAIDDVARVSRDHVPVQIVDASLARIALGRRRLDELIASGERIYGFNTGIGGNVNISPTPDQMELLQAHLVRHMACAAGQALPQDVVRAAALLQDVVSLGMRRRHRHGRVGLPAQ